MASMNKSEMPPRLISNLKKLSVFPLEKFFIVNSPFYKDQRGTYYEVQDYEKIITSCRTTTYE